MPDIFIAPKQRKRKTYVFTCPVCQKRFKSDEPGEPCCTGPSESRDEHPMEVMRLHSVQYEEVHPALAEARANGPLLMPGYLDELRDTVRELPKLILP